MVFGLEKIHLVLCGQYRKNPALVEGSHKVYNEMLADAQQPKPWDKEKYL